VTGATIQGNRIGTDITGTTSLGGRGISFPGGSGLIGGITPGAGNIIAGHASSGINNVSGTTETLAVLGNSIHSNGGLGIDWQSVGVTPNDPCDAAYPQNSPLLNSVTLASGFVTLSGTLNSLPSTTFRLEFFSSVQGDASDHGQGQTFLGAAKLALNAASSAFTQTKPQRAQKALSLNCALCAFLWRPRRAIRSNG
jgi:trimeric autotransporter adhesin